ncbi:amidohydrolase [Microcella humidisoli]|uniref:Amidohydrolase n=1 Tax=Microcella humidisoli TaxID=2963406 RepID=A0ABY5FVH7_9MICO|nr:amidohydrolase [Microcella humidisoli]UTT62137.1 amidohydrolase [Microcella humidisoli]
MTHHTMTDLAELYRDLHAHPELSFAETRTAAIVAERLRALDFAVTTDVGGTGVVGVLERGTGPTVLMRADMDALPVREETGLPYASTVTSVGPDGAEVPVMHACGHDMHVTALLGALGVLAAADDWQGRVLAVFQPAEEKGSGARAMIDDGLFSRFGTPDIVIGQHVAPLPAGALGVRTGAAFAASDALRITLFGRGGHGSRPEATVDPVVLAAATILRLQTVVSREIAATETAVVTVGAVHAGTAANIIPDSAELRLSIRTFDPDVRQRVLAAIERIVRAEALAAGADREPVIETEYSFPAVVNDAVAADRVRTAFAEAMPAVMVVDPGVVTGSEDVGILAVEAGAPCVYWLLGGADPAHFAGLTSLDEITATVASLPSNHSPQFAPVIEPTIGVGVSALVAAARAWLRA